MSPKRMRGAALRRNHSADTVARSGRSSHPCKSNPAACGGAKMAADHLTSTSSHLYGDYELRMRAPYVDTAPGGEEGASTGSSCPDGIYACVPVHLPHLAQGSEALRSRYYALICTY